MQGDAVVAKIRARNSLGWGPLSWATDSNTAALVEVKPLQMATPTRGASTTTTQIQVTWTVLSGLATGGATIDSYQLEWDGGTPGSWSVIQGGPNAAAYSTALTHTVGGGAVTPGTSY